MAGKLTGLGATINVDDSVPAAQDISTDVTNFTFGTPRATADITGVDKTAMERYLLLADFSVTLNGQFNNDANKSHAVFKTVPSTDKIRTTKIQPVSGATPYLSCETLYTDYTITRAAGGELTWAAPGVLADGTAPSWS